MSKIPIPINPRIHYSPYFKDCRTYEESRTTYNTILRRDFREIWNFAINSEIEDWDRLMDQIGAPDASTFSAAQYEDLIVLYAEKYEEIMMFISVVNL